MDTGLYDPGSALGLPFPLWIGCTLPTLKSDGTLPEASERFTRISPKFKILTVNTGSNMLDIKQFSSDLIDSSLDILTVNEKLLAFKEIKIIFTRYDFDQSFPVG
jgi:hypothetical protein